MVDCRNREVVAQRSAYGAQRKHAISPTDFRSPPQNGHSHYGHLMARFARFRSLMGQCSGSFLSDVGAFGCLRSLRAHLALDGVSWVQGGSVEIAVGQKTACYRIHAVICALPGRRSARELGWTSVSLMPPGYAGLNSVPCRSMACMMIARRRASAIRALRIVERLATANAQSLSFSAPL